MKYIFVLIVNIFLITISFSQAPCILDEVYVSEAANRGVPDDYIEVYNGGSEECTLVGFQLDDSEDLKDFIFGDVVLAPGDYWLGYKDAEDSFNFGLDADGDNVVFADADGEIRIIILAQSIATADGVELSQSYGSDGVGCYTLPTPGDQNADCFEFIYGCTDPEAINYDVDANIDDCSCEYSTVSCILGEVYVSEVQNQGDDYIEVHNGGSEDCTLIGFQLDDSDDLEDFTFGNVILKSDKYWYCIEDSEDCFSSGQAADGDIVVFANACGEILSIIIEESMATPDGLELSQSYESDGVGCYTLPTPGDQNADCFCTTVLGDVNGDGGYNVLDIVTLANCVLAQNCNDIEFACAADFNGDNIYNVLDIVQLANCVLAQNCSGRIDDATESKLIIKGNMVSFEADGFIGGVQMTLQHGYDFSIEMTDRALFADYLTTGNETRLLVISPETDDLFSFSGDFEITEVIVANSQNEVPTSLPTTYYLSVAYPNPFNPVTTMEFTIPEAGNVNVQVYNLKGQVVSTLISGHQTADTYNLTWYASHSPSGIYFVKAQADGLTSTQKLMLIK